MNSNSVHHIANRRHKKTIKLLQARLQEEIKDTKRLTMLLAAAMPTTNGVLKDLIRFEVSNMRYRYNINTDRITYDEHV